MSLPYPEEQPVLPFWPTARVLGYGRGRAYREAADGTFPIEVLRIGNRLALRTADVRRHAGLRLGMPEAS